MESSTRGGYNMQTRNPWAVAAFAHAPRTDEYLVDESGHTVQFYEDDAFLVDAVTRFIGAGLGAGDVAIVIATERHRGDVEERLRGRGLDLVRAREEGRYVPLDAAETLSNFMLDGRPDQTCFDDVVGGVIARAANGQHPRVRAFGEMVGLLWAEGKREAAIRLEELWNDLAKRLPFSLLCAYPIASFGRESDGTLFRTICGEHSHVIPAESYPALASGDERLRAITQFQQKARTLEAEIVERKQQQRRAGEVQARLAAIVASSDDAIVSKTLDGIVTSWNRGAERIFGYTAEEMIGQSISRLVPPGRRDDLEAILGAIRRGDSVDHFETERVRKDGRTIHVSLTVSPIRDADGCIIGASKIARDVTDRRRAEEAKDEFLAMLGHELRNPLAAVQSAILTARLDESRREHALDIARRQTGQLRRLTDDLLDVSRVARGKIVLRKERFFLTSVVERSVESARTQVEERGHTLSVSLPPEIQIDGDAARMEQVLVNLLTNAAKYTLPGGRIEVVAELVGGEIVLRVRDNGIGISAEMLPYVFDLFSQADRSLDRAQGGLGIGLALVRRLVELHGGRVEARSGGCSQGAEFVVHLPAASGPEPEERADAQEASAAAQAATRARVLLVEDNVDAADALAMLLEVLGHKVEVAHDGLAALEAMQRMPPDVMLVDIGLPGIDGFEVARRARAVPNRKSTLLVALTGYGRDEDKERTLRAGFDYHLTKPVDIGALQELVAGLGRMEAGSGKPPTLQ
jgi:PAS domain S-box-containing protein